MFLNQVWKKFRNVPFRVQKSFSIKAQKTFHTHSSTKLQNQGLKKFHNEGSKRFLNKVLNLFLIKKKLDYWLYNNSSWLSTSQFKNLTLYCMAFTKSQRYWKLQDCLSIWDLLVDNNELKKLSRKSIKCL